MPRTFCDILSKIIAPFVNITNPLSASSCNYYLVLTAGAAVEGDDAFTLTPPRKGYE